MNSGIYKITNTINGKIYIGSAINITDRWNYHKWELNNNKHGNKYLQRAWNKYWSVSFEFSTLEFCEKDKLIEREQYWLDITKCYDREVGYNILTVAYSGIGSKRSLETKAKISASQLGKVMPIEAVERMRASKRDIDKWPHIDGCKCTCHECMYKKSEYSLAWKAKKLEKLNHEFI